MSFLGKNQYEPWTESELEYLRANYANNSIKAIALAMNRSPPAIKAKAYKLDLKNRRIWSSEEKEYLFELCGEYPLSQIVRIYNRWAKKQGYRVRTQRQIRDKLKNHKVSVRLNASSEYLTAEDLSYLLGCDRSTVYGFFRAYPKELRLNDTGKRCVPRYRVRRWLLEHRSILERYQQTLDINWLADILSN